MTVFRQPERADHNVSLLPCLTASPCAVRELGRFCRAHGRQVLVLSSSCAAPSIVTVTAERNFNADQTHVLVGKVAGCPVYADSREISTCPHGAIVIDWRGGAETPLMVTRGESEAERLDRAIRDRVYRPVVEEESTGLRGAKVG